MLKRITSLSPLKISLAHMQTLVSNLSKVSRYLPFKNLQEERGIVNCTFVLKHVIRFGLEQNGILIHSLFLTEVECATLVSYFFFYILYWRLQAVFIPQFTGHHLIQCKLSNIIFFTPLNSIFCCSV